MPVTLLSDPACHQTKAIKILGEYCGIKFSVEKGASKDAKSCFSSVVKCDDGTQLGDLTAIMIHLAEDKLLGSSKVNKAKVIQWLNLVNQLHHTSSQWLLPTIGQAEGTKQSVEKAKTDAKKVLKSLNDHLLSNSYLVGERISVADICLAATLLPLYEKMFDAKARGEYPNLTRYLDTLVHQPQFQAVVGQVKYCETAPVFKEGAVKKEQPKKEDKPKQAKKAPEPDDGGDFDDDGLPKEKPKDPWLALPKGNFDMDDFKRFFSNNPEDKSIPYFWEKFDKENFSIWFCEYKYPEELTLVFMSCNLITGMFQRLDKMRKWAFGSMLLFGEDHKNSISGVWVWRGQDLAFKLSPDWQVDYESYDWKKLDPDSPDTKKIVDEYFRWEGDFGGKKFNQGKIFK